MEINKNDFLLPKRYNHTLMERQNKREREILERRNIDIEFSNRPRLENPFFDSEKEEEENKIKSEIEEILKYIPIVIIKDQNDLIKKKNQCMICLSNYKLGDKQYILPCFHIFHTKCLKTWMFQKRYCPICKFDISLESLLSSDII